MKLSEVQVREQVPSGQVGSNTSRLKTEPGTGPSHGWLLEYEAGMVTACKGDATLLIPLGNVAYMRPEAVVVPVAKGKAA